MQELSHLLERVIIINARPQVVFQFFTDSARWARWWGSGSTIDAKPGGKVEIRYPNGVQVFGEVLEVHSPERIVFTYGYASGTPIAPGASRVTIRLQPDALGTRLHLLHEFAEAAPRDQHVQGWRFQLSLFSNVVADEVHTKGAPDLVDAWFEAWGMADDKAREESMSQIVSPSIRFRDRFSALEGLADLTAHIGASQRFMPGIRLKRKGGIRHCQGTLLVDWIAVGSDGAERMSGTSVIVLTADGRMDSVTGLANT